MTPGFQAAISRLEGQWRNLFQKIRRIRRSAAILLIAAGSRSTTLNDRIIQETSGNCL